MAFGTPSPAAPPVPPPNHPRAIAALVLGILGLVACMPLGIAAWVVANDALRQMDAHPGTWSGRGLVLAGKVLGIIAVVLLVVSILIVVAVFAFGGVITSIYQQTCSASGPTASC